MTAEETENIWHRLLFQALKSSLKHIKRMMPSLAISNAFASFAIESLSLMTVKTFYQTTLASSRELLTVQTSLSTSQEAISRSIKRSEHWQASNYQCSSPLAFLYQQILCQKELPEIKQLFAKLPASDQQLIYEIAQKKEDLFEDIGIFNCAVQSAVETKFDRLSQDEKKVVYRRVSELADKSSEDLAWGEQHAKEHMLRLAAAM